MNNLVSIIDGQSLTTSLAIAEGVGNPHASVIRLIRDNAGDLEDFGPLGFEIHVVKRPQGGGSKQEYALLNEQQATLLMTYMRNNDVVREFKKRLVRAFYEAANNSIPTNFAEALRLAADKAERVEQLEHDNAKKEAQIVELRPKVEFAERVAMAEDAITIAKAAKMLGTGRNRLLAKLRRMGWVTRRNEPYQAKIDAGLLDVKLGSWEHPEHGLKESVTTLVTGKGLEKLSHICREH